MNQLDFNLLQDLDALLREGSVAGAARRLHLSAPAMSRRLTRLRDAIGDPLFVPAGRGLVPTQRALDLRERVQQAIEEVRGVFAPDQVDFAKLERTMSIRANDGFAGAWASRLAATIAAEAPGVSLRFITRTDNHISALRDGGVDLDIGVLDAPEPEVHKQTLLQAGFVGVVRKHHPLVDKQEGANISAQDFVSWPHIAATRCGLDNETINDALRQTGLQRRVAVHVPGFQAALMMVASSDMVAAIPEPFAHWAMPYLHLHIFKLPVAIPDIEISQSWHPRHHADPVHRWLRQHVKTCF